MRSTLVFSKIFAPRCLAPLASACVVSIGLVWPSLGRKMPPTTSLTSSSGQRSLISPGVSSSIRRPKVLPIEAPRLSSSRRAAVFATLIEPFCLKPGGLAGLGLERVVQVGRVLREFGEVARGAQLPDQSGSVPGGAAGELLALEQDDVGDADLRQVIGDRAAGDAAPDDDDVRVPR